MSAKAKAASKPAKEVKKAPAAVEKEAKKAKGKGAKESDDPVEAERAQLNSGEESVDMEELEEQEEEAAARSSGSSSSAAAIAASSEMSASFKNFRNHPDMENFYRFIYENDLRHEALQIIDELAAKKLAVKKPVTGKAKHS